MRYQLRYWTLPDPPEYPMWDLNPQSSAFTTRNANMSNDAMTSSRILTIWRTLCVEGRRVVQLRQWGSDPMDA